MDDKQSRKQNFVDEHSKQRQLDKYRISNKGKAMTTNVGRKISDDEGQLKAGIRGPTLHEDHHFF